MFSVLYYISVFVFTLVYFVAFTAIFLLTVLFDRERKALHYASIVWARGIYALCPLWRVKLEGAEKIDRRKPYVVVLNHQSMLDIPLMYILPLCFKWVAKREVYKWPLFGWVMRMHGDIAIERGTAASAKKLVRDGGRRLKAGTSVIIFPEGTRSRDGRVGRFHEGAFVMAKSAGVDILPCVQEGTGSVIDGKRLRMPHTFTVRVLDPVPAAEAAAKSPRELAEAVRQTILEAHKELRKDLYE